MVDKCRVPVICAVHGLAIGAGVDLSAACDIRYATKDAKFSIKEVDIGLAADLGTLQRISKLTGNESWVREVAYTARFFTGVEAEKMGYVSRTFDSAEALFKAAYELAQEIAGKSPVAVATTKESIKFSRDHTVEEGLAHIANLNSARLQSTDMQAAIMANMQKKKPEFPRL